MLSTVIISSELPGKSVTHINWCVYLYTFYGYITSLNITWLSSQTETGQLVIHSIKPSRNNPQWEIYATYEANKSEHYWQRGVYAILTTSNLRATYSCLWSRWCTYFSM